MEVATIARQRVGQPGFELFDFGIIRRHVRIRGHVKGDNITDQQDHVGSGSNPENFRRSVGDGQIGVNITQSVAAYSIMILIAGSGQLGRGIGVGSAGEGKRNVFFVEIRKKRVAVAGLVGGIVISAACGNRVTQGHDDQGRLCPDAT